MFIIKKIFKNLAAVYILIILFPYLLSIFFYSILKLFAKEGSSLDAKLTKLESDLIQIILDQFKNADYGFIALNILAFIWLMIFLYLLKKYKIVIPKRKKKDAETNY